MKNTIWSFALILITFLSLGERCAAQHTVNWHVLNQVTSVQVEDGKSLTIPENINTAYCDDSKVFVGWTNNPIAEETDVVPTTLFSEPTGKVNADADYYAVFAEKESNEILLVDVEFNQKGVLPKEWTTSALSNMVTSSGVNLRENDYLMSSDFFDEDYSAIKIVLTMDYNGDDNSILTLGLYDKENSLFAATNIKPKGHSMEEYELAFVTPKVIRKFYIKRENNVESVLITECQVYGLTYTGYTTACSIETIDNKTIDTDKWSVIKDTEVNTLLLSGNGVVSVAAGCTLRVNSFGISTDFSNNQSGQLILEKSIDPNTSEEISGVVEADEAYIDITLGKNADPNQWHAFTVPFPVDVINGIYDTDNLKLTNEVHYAIMDYHGDIRAKGQYAWKKYRGVLVPGTFYLMTVDCNHQTFRFKKLKDAALVAENLKKLTAYSDNGNENLDKGWNGVGNPTLMYGTVNHKVLVLDPESYTYKGYQPYETQFTVGTPFFIQVAEEGKMSMLSEVPASIAPIRNSSTLVQNIKLLLANDNYADYLYISASESATNDYEIGKDLLKMSMTTAPSVPQISAKAYGTQLCMIDVPAINDEIAVELNLYAPIEGEYRMSIHENEDIELYLLHHGKIVHRLSSHETTIGLQQGNNAGYSILVRKPTTTNTQSIHTSHDNIDKIMYDNQLIIIHNGNSYDIMGRKR